MARLKIPKDAITSGYVLKLETLEDIGTQMGVDVDRLVHSVERFNQFALRGVDEDHHPGNTSYKHSLGDPRHKPNPNLGTIEKPPFFGMKVYPGDIGTKGGLLTDEHARVLREDGTVIPGLYAAGNTTASLMGKRRWCWRHLGPACTFAYIAVNHVANVEN
ncbi:hypothetical protein M427DRAFT_32365 [Gonapodya prolifera JEL478]|uniref:FAD-dependent oxidoreductase 2 FAD-binding domain-containing protein n=1 Tax=Gonapodya prolifera (strain JEL478) TaxID=1344416 RepID=A0A139AG46_GONPJ|nr:hypothetical protein M427DRAFT_32365 [Gonapodya prolifera JEL478]|eukprot:KXS15405.1 hypothetical protein M427DRAFT_32365 [Gonapodya prolifera JEL478]